MQRSPRRVLAGALLPAALLLAGCGDAPWQEAGGSASPTATPTRTATPSPSATPVKAPAKNDLSQGVARRTLKAGGIELKATYYSSLPMPKWTPEASKPLTLSLTAGFPGGYKQDIFLSDLSVRMDVTGAEGALTAPAPIEDHADVAPGYLIKKPNAYGNVFTVPALPDDARSVALTFTYQLLAPANPKSKVYSKQVATDTVTVAIA